MRYRVKDYVVSLSETLLTISVDLPAKIESTDDAEESIRLVIDETIPKVICSSMQKQNINTIVLSDDGMTLSMTFDISEYIDELTVEDDFTIELDLGITNDNSVEEINRKIGSFNSEDRPDLETILQDLIAAYTEHKTLIVEAMQQIGFTDVTTDTSWIQLASYIANIELTATPMTDEQVETIFNDVLSGAL